jgi:hypothetical protein
MSDPILPSEIKGANGSSRILESLLYVPKYLDTYSIPLLILLVRCLQSVPKNRPSSRKFQSRMTCLKVESFEIC